MSGHGVDFLENWIAKNVTALELLRRPIARLESGSALHC